MAEYQLDDGNIVFKDTLTERIVDTYFANFSELIDKNHDTISKSFDDMDTVILNFTKTLEQLKAWLKVKLCEAYVNSQVRLDSTEVSELNRIMRNVIRKNFFTKEAKTCSLWNPLRGITIAPHHKCATLHKTGRVGVTTCFASFMHTCGFTLSL